MASEAEVLAKTYKPGDICEASGIYKVTHDPKHAAEHDVTVIIGKKFPPCNHCGDHPRFKAIKLAHHIENNEHFKK